MVDLDMQAARLVGRATSSRVLDDFVRGSASGGVPCSSPVSPGSGSPRSSTPRSGRPRRAARGSSGVAGSSTRPTSASQVLHQLVGPLGDHVEELPASRAIRPRGRPGAPSGPAPDRLSVLDAALATFRRQRHVAAPRGRGRHALARRGHRLGCRLRRPQARRQPGRPAGCGPDRGGGLRGRAGPARAGRPAARARGVPGPAQRPLRPPPRPGAPRRRRGGAGQPAGAAGVRGSGGIAPDPRLAVRRRGGHRGRPAVRRLYDERVARLPADTRRLLLLAALEGSGNLAVLASAGGPGLQALGPAERDHLVIVDERVGKVVFRHPMVKSVVVEESTHDERRTAHAVWPRCSPDTSSDAGSTSARQPSSRRRRWPRPSRRARTRPSRGDVVGGVSRLQRAASLSPSLRHRGRGWPGRRSSVPSPRAAGERVADAAGGAGEDPRLGDSVPAAAARRTCCSTPRATSRPRTASWSRPWTPPWMTPVVTRRSSRWRSTRWWPCATSPAGRSRGGARRAAGAAPRSSAPDAAPRPRPTATRRGRRVGPVRDRPCRLGAGRHPGRRPVVRTSVAGSTSTASPRAGPALDRVVRDGLDGGAAGSAVMALNMVAFDDLGAGRWTAPGRWRTRRSRWVAAAATRSTSGPAGTPWRWSPPIGASTTSAGPRATRWLAWARPRGVGRLDDCVHHVLASGRTRCRGLPRCLRPRVGGQRPGHLEGHNPQALWCALDLVDAGLHSGRAARGRRAHRRHAGRRPGAPLSPLRARHRGGPAMVASDDEAPRLFEERAHPSRCGLVAVRARPRALGTRRAAATAASRPRGTDPARRRP